MNPYVLLAAMILWVATSAGSYYYGAEVGRDGEIANRVAVADAVEQTRKAAQLGAANAISKIKTKNVTVRGKTETIVRESVRYVDCRHEPDGMRLINEALTGKPIALGGFKLPRVDASN